MIGAIIGAGVLGAGASVYAAESASDAQQAAAQQGTDTQLQMYYRAREDLAPWTEAGQNALAQYQERAEAGPGEFTWEETPGYQFQVEQGTKALERGAAARGGLLSGRQQKDLTRFGQGLASTDYQGQRQNWLDEYYRSLEPSRWLAGTGQSAAAQQGAWGQAAGGNIAQNQLAAGQAQAGGYINQANALTGVLGGGLQNYMLWKAMNQGGGSGYPTAQGFPLP